jgi:SNF2 family DNA or RNA helicase
MLILHAAYKGGELYFWGEKPIDSDVALEAGPKAKGLTLFPYDAGPETIKNILAETLFDGSIRKQPHQEIAAWLPTAGSTATPSSTLLASAPPETTVLQLFPWKVSAVNIGLENAIGFLAACVDKELLTPGVLAGPDVAFWTKATRFAGALVARQEYLPDLVDYGDGYRALWDPIFLGSDADYLDEMIKGMPHACRCVEVDLDTKTAPMTAPAAQVSNYIVAVVDFLARYSIFSQPQSTWPKSFRTDEEFDFDSIHDHWVNALVCPSSRMRDGLKELDGLHAQITEWRRPISLSTATPFKLCLSLEEPDPEKSKPAKGKRKKEEWFVHFHLQSIANPSLMIPADHVWNPTAEEVKVLNSKKFNAKEYLLSSLGKASTICPRIEDSLKTVAPTGYSVDTAGAYEFLTQRVWALEQAGFGTQTPPWWTQNGSKHRLGTRANVKSPVKRDSKAGFSLEQILHFDWEITLGGDKVTREELHSLSKKKIPLVNMRGRWIQLGEDEIVHALDLTSTKRKGTTEGSLREIVQMALGSSKAPGGFSFDGVQSSGWVSDFLDQLEGGASFEELGKPEGMVGKLRPYQLRGFSWLHFLRQWGLGACLADDMGLGKTIQALALVQHEYNSGSKKPILVICPTSLTGNWYKETQRFNPGIPVMVHHGINRPKGDAFKEEVEKHTLVISSYSLLHRDIDVFKKIDWGGIILDEAQNIKNPKTKQARSARVLKGEFRMALTGTPIENNVGDLWSIMEFLNQGFLGTQADFKRRFLMPIQANRESKAVDNLKKLTEPFILRRLKSDKNIIKDLPGKMEMKTYCTLTKEQAALYEALVRDMENALDSSDGMHRKGLVLATLTKLKQICNHPAQYLGEPSPLDKRSGKLARLTEMLEEIIQVDERALVFTQFVEMGKIVQQHVQEVYGRKVIFLHGGVPKKQRDDMVESFQEDEDGPHVFVLSLKAGGTGLNLTRANHVFHYDRWWNPAVENQATDRVHRIGQTKNVQIHKFLCAGTLEERIDDMIEHKRGLAESIVSSGEAWLTELSTGELKNLFSLQQEAIGE